MINTFLGKEVLRDESSRTLWNLIVKSGYVDDNEGKRGSGIAPSSPTSKLLMAYMETDEMMWSARKCASIDVRVGWVGDILLLGYLGDVRIPKTGGRFFLIGRDVPRQTKHDDFICSVSGFTGILRDHFRIRSVYLICVRQLPKICVVSEGEAGNFGEHSSQA